MWLVQNLAKYQRDHQVGQATSQIFGDMSKPKEGYDISYNWPYDFVSFVESIRIDVDVMYKDPANRNIKQTEADSQKTRKKANNAKAQNDIQNKGRRRRRGNGNKRGNY